MNHKLTTKKAVWILVLYFVGYMFIFPLIAGITTEILYINTGDYHDIPVSMVIYILVLGLVIWLAKDALKDYIRVSKQKLMKTLGSSAFRFLQMFGLFVIINLVVMMIIGREANNEVMITEMMEESLLYVFFISCIFAPIVEEVVFREVLLVKLKSKFNMVTALIVSSFLFGFVHVIDAVLLGTLDELIFIISYGGMGAVLGLAYLQEDNGAVNILMHFLNNLISLLITVMYLSA